MNKEQDYKIEIDLESTLTGYLRTNLQYPADIKLIKSGYYTFCRSYNDEKHERIGLNMIFRGCRGHLHGDVVRLDIINSNLISNRCRSITYSRRIQDSSNHYIDNAYFDCNEDFTKFTADEIKDIITRRSVLRVIDCETNQEVNLNINEFTIRVTFRHINADNLLKRGKYLNYIPNKLKCIYSEYLNPICNNIKNNQYIRIIHSIIGLYSMISNYRSVVISKLFSLINFYR